MSSSESGLERPAWRRWRWEHALLVALLLVVSARLGRLTVAPSLTRGVQAWALAEQAELLADRQPPPVEQVAALCRRLSALRPADGDWERAVRSTELTAYLHAGRLREAELLVDDLLRNHFLSGQEPYLALTAGDVLLRSGRAGDALSVTLNAVLGNPVTAPAQVELRRLMARSLNRLARAKEAETVYRGLLAAAPDEPDALNALAYQLAVMGSDLGEAEALSRRSLALIWGDRWSWLAHRERQRAAYAACLDTLGWVLYRADRREEAERVLRQAVRTAEPHPQAEILVHLGRLLCDQGDDVEAASLANRALKLEPDLPEARQLLDHIQGPRPEGQVG